jgi:drug/metabolite transporter (DMT)-like permease
MPRVQAFILLHLIVFLWGFTGVIGKLLHQDPFIIVWYRLLIACFALCIYLWIKKFSFNIERNQWLYVMLVGLVVALHWITFYYAIQISTASLGILCLATTTFHVVWLEPIILKTKFSWTKLLFSLIVVSGVAFIARDFKGNVMLAVFLGLFSALLAGVFSVSNARLAKKIDAPVLSLYELLTGFIGISIYLVTIKTPASAFQVSFTDACWLLFLGLVCTSFAFITAIILVKILGAYTVSLTINLEPVYTMALAIFLLNEHKVLTVEFYLSAGLIIGTLMLNGWVNRESRELNS